MCEIIEYVINPANDQIKIIVNDELGAGGANHRYEITGFDIALIHLRSILKTVN